MTRNKPSQGSEDLPDQKGSWRTTLVLTAAGLLLLGYFAVHTVWPAWFQYRAAEAKSSGEVIAVDRGKDGVDHYLQIVVDNHKLRCEPELPAEFEGLKLMGVYDHEDPSSCRTEEYVGKLSGDETGLFLLFLTAMGVLVLIVAVWRWRNVQLLRRMAELDLDD